MRPQHKKMWKKSERTWTTCNFGGGEITVNMSFSFFVLSPTLQPFSFLIIILFNNIPVLAAIVFHIPYCGFPHSVGQRGEPGAGPPTFKQSPGWRLGPQAAARSVHRDLCPGHWQHAAQPVPGGFVSPRLPIPSGATAALCDHLPAGRSWGWKDNEFRPWQELAPAPQQCHHALYSLQTQGTQWRAVPAEPSQDTHANVLPTSARRTHPKSQWAQPRDIHLSIRAFTDIQVRSEKRSGWACEGRVRLGCTYV